MDVDLMQVRLAGVTCGDGHGALLDLRALLDLAARLRGRAQVTLPLIAPAEWVDRAGFDLLSVATVDEVREAEADEETVAYVWCKDERERGLRVYCGLSRRWLASERVEHTGEDVWYPLHEPRTSLSAGKPSSSPA